MNRFRFPLIALAVIVSIAFASCSSHTPTGPVGPYTVSFDIVVPSAIVQPANYYAMSGLLAQNGATRIGDTTIEVRTQIYYAQFFKGASYLLPAHVTVNNLELTRNPNTDTLRLASSSTSAANVYGTNTWTLTDSDGTAQKFPIGAVDPLDSIAPFERNPTVRGDTDLVLGWKVPDASQGIYLVWTSSATQYSYMQYIGDAGRFVVPKEEMKKLAGTGRIWFTRFNRSVQPYKNGTICLLRLSQRYYRVTVQP